MMSDKKYLISKTITLSTCGRPSFLSPTRGKRGCKIMQLNGINSKEKQEAARRLITLQINEICLEKM